jgi:ABC-type dipeptide/oligopeptide/nickel transport system permease subunit
MVVLGRTPRFDSLPHVKGKLMNKIIYIVGVVVIVVAILSFFGFR